VPPYQLSGGCMRQLFGTAVLVFGLLLLLGFPARAGEEDVLEALEAVKTGVKEKVSYTKLAELLDAAHLKVNTLQRGVANACFRAAARRCYDWYALGVRSWASLIGNEKQRDKYARQAAYGERDLKDASLKIAENYATLVRHTQDALPSKWAYAELELRKAHECLEAQARPK
jgi:hypothetical protein